MSTDPSQQPPKYFTEHPFLASSEDDPVDEKFFFFQEMSLREHFGADLFNYRQWCAGLYTPSGEELEIFRWMFAQNIPMKDLTEKKETPPGVDEMINTLEQEEFEESIILVDPRNSLSSS